MALAAAQVIDALAARVSPLAPAGGVHTSRAWPLATLPAWRVFAGDEAVTEAMMSGINEHALDVEVQGTAHAAADLDDALHAMASAALAALFTAPVPYQLQLAAIQRRLATEGEASVGRITLRVRATFYVDPAAPETIVPTL
jgi:hypothetical protein